MSWNAQRWAYEDAPMLRTSNGKADTTARAVLGAIAYHADEAGKNAYAGPDRLQFETGFEARTIKQALTRLESAGLIERAGTSRFGTTAWNLAMTMRRPASDWDELSAKQDATRAATAERVRAFRSRQTGVTQSDDVTQAVGVTQSDCKVTPSKCVTGLHVTQSNSDVTQFDCGCNAVRFPLTTQEPPKEPPLTRACAREADEPTTSGALRPDSQHPETRTLTPEAPSHDNALIPAPPVAKPKAKPKKTADYPADFMAFWEAAPRRRGTERGSKPEALKEWRAALARGIDNTSLIAAAKAYARTADPNYVKDTCRWLKGELYEPYLEQAQRHTAGEPTDAELDAVLGKALITLPAPPEGVVYGSPEHQQWKARFFAERRAERVRLYLARTAKTPRTA